MRKIESFFPDDYELDNTTEPDIVVLLYLNEVVKTYTNGTLVKNIISDAHEHAKQRNELSKIEVDPDLTDPDYLAYIEMKESGKFNGFKKGSWVAILDGLIFASNINKGELMKTISRATKETCFVDQVNIEKEAMDMGAAKKILEREVGIDFEQLFQAYSTDSGFLKYRDGEKLTEADLINDILDDGKSQLDDEASFEDIVTTGALTIAAPFDLV